MIVTCAACGLVSTIAEPGPAGWERRGYELVVVWQCPPDCGAQNTIARTIPDEEVSPDA